MGHGRLRGGRCQTTPSAGKPFFSRLHKWFVVEANIPNNLNKGYLGLLDCSAVIQRQYRDARSVVGVHTRHYLVSLGDVVLYFHTFSCVVNGRALQQSCLSAVDGFVVLIRAIAGHCRHLWSSSVSLVDQFALISVCVDIGEYKLADSLYRCCVHLPWHMCLLSARFRRAQGLDQ